LSIPNHTIDFIGEKQKKISKEVSIYHEYDDTIHNNSLQSAKFIVTVVDVRSTRLELKIWVFHMHYD
jgi:hypothetical protein